MNWLIIGLIIGIITGVLGERKIQYFRPITHHGGILGVLPSCNHCTCQIDGLGIRTGSKFPFRNYYHISCWLRKLIPKDRR